MNRPKRPHRRRAMILVGALAAGLAAAAFLIVGGGTSRTGGAPRAGEPRDLGHAPPLESSPDAAVAVAVATLAEREPNDATAAAQLVEGVPAVIEGQWTPGDHDVFRLVTQGPTGQLLHAWLEDTPALRLRVIREDGSELGQATAPASLRALPIAAGIYFVAVEEGEAGTGARTPYRLHVDVSAHAPGVEAETNDVPAQASEMAARTAARGELARYEALGWWSRPDDVDCFRVPLLVPPAGAVLRLELRPPPGLVARLRVYDAGDPEAELAPRLLAEATAPSPGAAAALPALGARSWEAAYVACAAVAGGDAFDASYRLEVRSWTPPGPFEFEPNDTRATASALPRGTPVSAYLQAGDHDWYRVSYARAPAAGVTVTLSEGAAEVVLYDAEGHELGRGAGSPGGPTVAPPAAGLTFVEVTAGTANHSEARYTIRAEGRSDR